MTKHALMLIIFLLASACSPGLTALDPVPTASPDIHDAGWVTCRPSKHLINEDDLEPMLLYIKENYLNLHSLLIVQEGCLVFEQYFPPYTFESQHQIYSITKSAVSALVGIALEQGFLPEVGEPLISFFPDQAGLTGEKAMITVEQLLTMTSGLEWREDAAAFQALYDQRDWLAFMLSRPLAHQPGEAYQYCSGCSHLLTSLLEEATGDATGFAETYLFGPLGISDYSWETDPYGVPIGGWGLHMKPRDLAKFGLLYLQKGEWEGKQVLSPGWVEMSVSDLVSTGGNLDYGYQWYAVRGSDHFAALGLGGQLIYVAPELELVVVSTAEMQDHTPVFELLDNFILPAAVEKPAR